MLKSKGWLTFSTRYLNYKERKMTTNEKPDSICKRIVALSIHHSYLHLSSSYLRELATRVLFSFISE